ncbi:MAG: hypothetical protein ACFFCZ_15275 [Promethearchaeota archaeon]
MASKIEKLSPETLKALKNELRVRESEFLLTKGASILTVPCSRAIAGKHQCILFGNVAMCPENCTGFVFGSPVDETVYPDLNVSCKNLDRVGEDYVCLETGEMNEEINCDFCSLKSKKAL